MTNQKNGYMFTTDRHRLPNTNKKVSKVRNVNNIINLIKRLKSYIHIFSYWGV